MTTSGLNTNARLMSPADRIAAESGDAILLVARMLLGVMFLIYGFNSFPSGLENYLRSLGMPVPAVMAPIGSVVQIVGGLGLILGLMTRYATAFLVLFVVVATVFAHRYWEYADAARVPQMANFWKNITIIGGMAALFCTGGGRYSLDALWRKS